MHVQVQNLPGLTLDAYLNRPAAYLAIGGEALLGNTGVNQDLERLPAERALNGFVGFHESIFGREWRHGNHPFER